MKVVNRRCAGLDVHKDEVVACVRLAGRGEPSREVRRFSTTTRGLLELADWLEASEVTQVAMEATGVYSGLACAGGALSACLANAAHVRNVPGRKSASRTSDMMSKSKSPLDRPSSPSLRSWREHLSRDPPRAASTPASLSPLISA